MAPLLTGGGITIWPFDITGIGITPGGIGDVLAYMGKCGGGTPGGGVRCCWPCIIIGGGVVDPTPIIGGTACMFGKVLFFAAAFAAAA